MPKAISSWFGSYSYRACIANFPPTATVSRNPTSVMMKAVGSKAPISILSMWSSPGMAKVKPSLSTSPTSFTESTPASLYAKPQSQPITTHKIDDKSATSFIALKGTELLSFGKYLQTRCWLRFSCEPAVFQDFKDNRRMSKVKPIRSVYPSVSSMWPTRYAAVFHQYFFLGIEMPSKCFSCDVAIVTPAAAQKAFMTECDMKSTMNPTRARPSTRDIAPHKSAKTPAPAILWPSVSKSIASSACPVNKLITAVGPGCTWRMVPNKEYPTKGAKEAYKPVCSGNPASNANAKHCGTNMRPTVKPAIVSPCTE
mmetsp:Transcript_16879/g.39257  ORF Transcript_16879/g.39257 Transcript_16879/m.39257 type:complete len:312 (-) Transcript_16879:449-1384(-)